MTASKLALLGSTALFALGLGLTPVIAQDAAAEEEAYAPSGMAAALGSDVEDADVIDKDKAPEPYAGSGMAAALGSDVEEPVGTDDVPKPALRRAEAAPETESAVQ